MKQFVSKLGPSMTEFLDFKHALGFKYKTQEVYLHELDVYNYDHGNHSNLSKDLAEGWVIEKMEQGTSEYDGWMSYIREYGKFLVINGVKDAYILDEKFKTHRYHPEVYLMTQTEIEIFFKECDQYSWRDKKKFPSRPYVYPAIYRFMYSCGVRTCEARNLKCNDVHLNDRYIDIVDAKAFRDRRLFLSDELTQYLCDYAQIIRKIFPEREYFFPGCCGSICSKSAIDNNFKALWLSAGLKRDGKVKARAYDFRHHFACANIMRWHNEGKDVHAMLPYLMTYMGHSSLDITYYYIHLIPDFFPEYQDLSSESEELIPEDYYDEV